AQRPDDVLLALDGIDGLEPELRHPLLAPALADRRARRLATEERARALGVPRAALVLADPARAGREDRVAHGVERLGRHEHDELAAPRGHVCRPAASGTAAACPRWRSSPAPRPPNATTCPSRSRWTSTSPCSWRRSRTGSQRGR